MISGEQIRLDLAQTATAARKLMNLSDQDICDILNALAEIALENIDVLLKANQKDLDRMDPTNPKYDRLLLNEKRIHDICNDLRKVASLPSPLHQTLESKTLENGLQLSKISVPLGVIGIVYESRPNVTFDVFALCLKSGNAVVLKGSRDAHDSNLAIAALIHNVLRPYGLEGTVYLAPSDREALPHILHAHSAVDLIIPRGSQGLIDFVRQNATVPVIETGAGIVHTYFDKSGDLNKGKSIIQNAKTRRVSVCNALDTLLIHESRITDLPSIVQGMDGEHNVKIFADDQAYAALNTHYQENLLSRATAESFGTEFLDYKMSIKTVASAEEAIEHVSQYSSKHSEAIIAEDEEIIDFYTRNIDAAVVYTNASTAFTDGAQFGLGAEIGISTQKLHARGPMALRELTSYKWIARGTGQVRP